MSYLCPKCKNHEALTEKGLKRHMTTDHGSYTEEDLRSVGIEPTRRDIARTLSGFDSAASVTAAAPEGETVASAEPAGRRGRPKKVAPADAEIAAAKQRILKMRCERAASMPYTLAAKIFHDETLLLEDSEKEELTAAYLTLAQAYGWEGTSKLLLWADIAMLHGAFIAERKGADLVALFSTPDGPDDPKYDVKQPDKVPVQ